MFLGLHLKWNLWNDRFQNIVFLQENITGPHTHGEAAIGSGGPGHRCRFISPNQFPAGRLDQDWYQPEMRQWFRRAPANLRGMAVQGTPPTPASKVIHRVCIYDLNPKQQPFHLACASALPLHYPHLGPEKPLLAGCPERCRMFDGTSGFQHPLGWW